LVVVLAVPLLVTAAGAPAQERREAAPRFALRHLANVPKAPTNTDLAFWGRLAFAGNYDGFRIFDISTPSNPRLLADVACRGPQNDVSAYQAGSRLLMFLSVDRAQTSPSCEGSADTPTISVGTGRFAQPGFEGIRIFDATDPAAPRQIGAVATACGSHTHTLVPDPSHGRLLIYVSSFPLGSSRTPPGYPDFAGPRCDVPHGKISIVTVPLDRPEAASLLKEQRLDPRTHPHGHGALDYPVVGCHDIQVYLSPRRKLAAAACMSEGQLWDISDPADPRTVGRITRIENALLDFWHSAVFSWDGRYVLFGDETLSAGAHCGRGALQGNIWIYPVVTPGRPTRLLGSYSIPRAQRSYCSVHLFDVIPGRRLLVASGYGGGTTVVDFSRPGRMREVAHFTPANANAWAAYWYDGAVYTNDIDRGLDVLRLTQGGRALRVPRLGHLNPQTQELPLSR
jgi:hypothetical protein